MLSLHPFKSWYLCAMIYILATSSLCVGTPFNDADENKDGVLQPQEFDNWRGHLREAISPYLGSTIDEAEPIQGAQATHKSSFVVEPAAFWAAFVNSLVTIWATEIGDKTFFIAAVMAMRNARLLVFGGAISALIVMTVLSVLMGSILTILPKAYTHYAGAAMFLYFGIRMLKDAQGMDKSGPSEELAEVEEELNAKKAGDDASVMEDGLPTTFNAVRSSRKIQIFTQAFSLTFLAEWGDRSQIATIALAAIKDPIGVTLGAIIGHAMCTGLAVVGGRLLAARISERQVAIAGGILFLLFGLHSLIVGPES